MLESLAHLTLPAHPSQLRILRHAVRDALESQGCSGETCEEVVLAVNEAAMNVIQHAYCGSDGNLIVEILREGAELIFRLVDFAPTIDASCVKARQLDEVRPGGLGVHFIEEVMDSMRFLPPDPGVGNVLELRKRIGD